MDHIRVEPDDPTRCQAIAGAGQCPYKAYPKSKFCGLHNGQSHAKTEERRELHNYRLSIIQQRASEFAYNDNIKSLRDEIAILRVLMETLVNTCKDPRDLLMNIDRVVNLTDKIEKLVRSCHQIEERSGNLLDKDAVIQIAMSFVTAVSKRITDTAILDALANELVEIVVCTNSNKSLPTVLGQA